MKKHSITWYVKWLATCVLVLGTLVNGLGYHPLGPMILIVGAIMWLYVGIIWRENAVIATNTFMALAGIIGLLFGYLP